MKHVDPTLSQREITPRLLPRATSRLPSEIRHLSGGRGKTTDELRGGEEQLSNFQERSSKHLAGMPPALCLTRGCCSGLKRKCVPLFSCQEEEEGSPIYLCETHLVLQRTSERAAGEADRRHDRCPTALRKRSRSSYPLTTATCSRAPSRRNFYLGVARAATISDQNRNTREALKRFRDRSPFEIGRAHV